MARCELDHARGQMRQLWIDGSIHWALAAHLISSSERPFVPGSYFGDLAAVPEHVRAAAASPPIARRRRRK